MRKGKKEVIRLIVFTIIFLYSDKLHSKVLFFQSKNILYFLPCYITIVREIAGNSPVKLTQRFLYHTTGILIQYGDFINGYMEGDGGFMSRAAHNGVDMLH